ncbi:MAG: hypothetical protein EXR98_04545 [Gemmataceae bacterium]|nr:hypothetical protein [Gemmataceae bacterium]
MTMLRYALCSIVLAGMLALVGCTPSTEAKKMEDGPPVPAKDTGPSKDALSPPPPPPPPK